MAGALEKRGDFDEALRNYLEGNATYRANCESDPTDSEDCLQMASTEDRIAGIYMRKGRVKEALAQYQVALAATQPISDSAKPNLEAIYTVVNLTYGIGEAYRAMAIESRQPAPLKREACVWYQKSRDAFSRISEWHPIAPTEFDARSGREIETRLRGCQSVRIPNTPRQVSTAAGNRRPSK
jgi:tetratricopeptide (TPR) repeat protein